MLLLFYMNAVQDRCTELFCVCMGANELFWCGCCCCFYDTNTLLDAIVMRLSTIASTKWIIVVITTFAILDKRRIELKSFGSFTIFGAYFIIFPFYLSSSFTFLSWHSLSEMCRSRKKSAGMQEIVKQNSANE